MYVSMLSLYCPSCLGLHPLHATYLQEPVIAPLPASPQTAPTPSPPSASLPTPLLFAITSQEDTLQYTPNTQA